MMKIARDSKIIFFYYVFIFIWWAYFFFTGRVHVGGSVTLEEALYQFAFGLIPLFGGILGFFKSKKWGGLRSSVGRALFFISIGAICWGVGQMFWSVYYNIISKVDIPYPSLADVGYSLSFPCLAIGLIDLSKATGAKFSFKHPKGKLLAILITVIGAIAAYYLLVVIARGGKVSANTDLLKVFFDFAYPLGDLTILLSSLLVYGLSFKYLGGRYKFSIISILLGQLVLFFGDFSFSYTTTVGTYFNGHWVDMVLPTAWMLIVFGVNGFEFKHTD